MDNAQGNANFAKNFLPYLKIMKDCGAQGKGCMFSGYYNRLNGLQGGMMASDPNSAYLIRLTDGTGMTFRVWSADCSWNHGTIKDICGYISVDLNGDTLPNTIGIDYFPFYVAKNKLIPSGIEGDTLFPFATYCRKNNMSDPAGYSNGTACTAWVIYNENMDYLHCNDLSWNGKTKCK
jgi:hypothetical protein